MAGIGAAINTGEVSHGQSVAVFGCGGVGDAAIAGSKLAGASTIIAVDIDDRKLEWATGVRRHAHLQLDDDRSGRVHPIGHRRERRRRVHRGDRPPRGLQAVLRGPRPRGHRRARRCAEPRDDRRAAVHRDLRPGRRAEVVVVRRLPARAGLPDADRPVPAGSARPRRLRVGDDRARRRRGRPSTRWNAARCSAAWWCCDDRTGHDRRHLRPRRRRVGGHEQHLDRRRRPRGAGLRRRARSSADRRCGQRPQGRGRSCSPTATTTTSTPRSRCATRSTPRSCSTRPTGCCGTSSTRITPPTAPSNRARPCSAGGHELGVLHTPGHSPGCCCFHDVATGAVMSGDTLFCGGPGATGRSLLRRADDPRVDPRRPAGAARPHRRAHRARRHHHHRRRARRRARPCRRTRPLTEPATHPCDER